jgi:hypothetical protein
MYFRKIICVMKWPKTAIRRVFRESVNAVDIFDLVKIGYYWWILNMKRKEITCNKIINMVQFADQRYYRERRAIRPYKNNLIWSISGMIRPDRTVSNRIKILDIILLT